MPRAVHLLQTLVVRARKWVVCWLPETRVDSWSTTTRVVSRNMQLQTTSARHTNTRVHALVVVFDDLELLQRSLQYGHESTTCKQRQVS